MADDTIVPRGRHPEGAVYVARDKKSGAEVSFDEFGRKLDSVGNVVHGDRQRAKDAGAKRIQKPEPELHLKDLKPAPSKGPPPKLVSMQGPVPNTTTARSPWDKSPMASEYGNGVAPSAPGGYNPYKNRSFPASMPPSMADITGSANRLNGQTSTTDTSVPVPPIGAQAPQGEPPRGWRPEWDFEAAENFMGGNSDWSPLVPVTPIPGFGGLPTRHIPAGLQGQGAPAIPMQTEGLNVYPGQELGRGRWDDTVPPELLPSRPQPPVMYPGQQTGRGRW
jgi:hypothetical protein